MASEAVSIPSLSSSVPTPAAPSADATSKPKPCCVCKDEKAQRDECMLFSKAADPAQDCSTIIDKYRSCMAGFGFQV